MIIGTTLHQGMDALTEWLPSEALNAFISVQLVANSTGNVDLEVTVLHKNRDEEGKGAVLGTKETIDGAALPKMGTINATGIKEMWRLRITAINGTGNSDWAHFHIPNPSFYDYEPA